MLLGLRVGLIVGIYECTVYRTTAPATLPSCGALRHRMASGILCDCSVVLVLNSRGKGLQPRRQYALIASVADSLSSSAWRTMLSMLRCFGMQRVDLGDQLPAQDLSWRCVCIHP
jgi:hypothetical protein